MEEDPTSNLGMRSTTDMLHQRNRSHTRARSWLADIRTEIGDGNPLDAEPRRILERSFDVDLSAIRVHDSPRADRLTRALAADAFATGSHLFFRTDTFRPQTEPGMWLLAHEVTHSIQQAQGAVSRTSSEIAADQAAGRVLLGKPAQVGRGLQAVPALPANRPLVIQRHGSWEHRLLGDASPDDLNSIAKNASNRADLLKALLDFLQMWEFNPDSVTADRITARNKNVRTLTLKTSGLLVTYGELNTLPDYVANSADMDDLPRDILRPILQAVRQEGYANALRLLGIYRDFIKFEGAVATHLTNGFMNDIWESIWLDDLTANLPPNLPPGSLRWGTNSYSAILARNACHFAPYSWYRWQASYDKALQKAQEHYQTKNPETAREAWIHHGYADHFLQDSFAAGHLVNKTLIMQWFAEWAAPKWYVSVPDWVEIQTMTQARQPGLAARGLYSSNPGSVRDPQTTQEQATKEERIAMSGVRADGPISRDSAYQNYLVFLNSSVSQASTLAVHDYINRKGLYVASKDQPTPFEIWGDGTMLNGGDGVRIASETAHMSQQSIQDVLERGTTSITPDRIRNRFPSMARPESGNDLLPLEQWTDSMKGRAFEEFAGVHDIILSAVKPRIGHISGDQAYFVIKLSRNGMEGYLARGGNDWAVLADRDHAARLRTRIDGGDVYYGTEDDKWLSVGTVGVNEGYVGLYGWKTTGYPNWKYDPVSKRLSSALGSGPMGLREYSDGHIYCYAGAGYVPAEVELEYVP
jgi:hypothetical protein